ncbi:bifunctional diguanylate cyclase/phosphodiesterase [Deinococcus sp. JMULE3]|uniref:putative bifunctional diguanylate cyclase/phosphodiesterase n=1 Tax=Deinococcus sp. JMULE3 TaxID=2518341 RepID=UPI00157653FF|nr:bifunctional diguanylate cyclase/phosphodiesterase [Deinococcus sp. JMULE3]NTY00489.1 bifunctional diguanylate cyclase/phosphodiesterase [Deinococcus sp. JMULE3]
MTVPAVPDDQRGTRLVLGALLGLYVLHLLNLRGQLPPGAAQGMADQAYVLLFVGSGVLTWVLAGRAAFPAPWRWMAGGTALWGLGQLVYAALDQADVQVTLADPLFLAYPACFLVAFMLVERRWPSLPGWAARLDVLAMVSAVSAFAWFFLLAAQAQREDVSRLDNVVTMLYPLSDLLLLALLLAQVWRGMTLRSSTLRRSLALLAAGMLAFVVADLGFVYLTLRGEYGDGVGWPDALWPLGALLLPAALSGSLAPPRAAPPRRAGPPTLVSLLAPYLSLVAAFSLLLLIPQGLPERGALLLTFLTALLVAARQTLAVRDLRVRTGELARSQAQVQAEALRDPLTGLGNRLKLNGSLDHALKVGGRVGLVMLDLDDFRFVNDALGHRAGDEFLRETARRVLAVTGTLPEVGQACCSRLGADEFVVLLRDTTAGTLMTLSERLRDALSQPVNFEGQELRLSASVGAALADPAQDAGAALRRVDLALAEVKRRGGNGAQLFDPARDDAAAARRVLLEARLRGALDRDELTLHYQPMLDADGQVRRAEALLRWTDPELGAVSPAEFVPVAEDAGFMPQVDLWVIARACSQLRAWRDAGVTWQVSVNVTPPLLLRPEFVSWLAAQLTAHELRPGDLELEVTERVLVASGERLREPLAALRVLGVDTALDDFGVGQSSLSSLLHLPIRTLKIDRAFVRVLDCPAEAQRGAQIVGAIVALGRALGLRVVAEGVETDAQAQAVWALGVSTVQGFWFARPAAAGNLPPGLTGPRSSDLQRHAPGARGGGVLP